MTIDVAMTVNGKAVSGKVEARTLLVQFLREHLGMTGTHVGCDTSQCGACVVHLDGKSIKSCTILAVQAEGGKVLTIEGLAERREAASDAGSFPREPCAAVRLLHPGNGDERDRHGEASRLPARRGDRATRARGQPLPLHRLPQYREGNPGRRAGNEVCRSVTP
jgi:hypothetical protein